MENADCLNGAKKKKPVFGFVNRYSYITALILCAVFFAFYFCVNGFRVMTAGDDLVIAGLVESKDVAVNFVGYFFMVFTSFMQPLFAHISFYFIFQELICFLSLSVINYLFIRKFGRLKGIGFSVFFDAAYFSFYMILIQFTHTAAIGSLAGMLCIINSLLFEKRKPFRFIQLIGGIVLVVISSQIRFEPFYALFAILFSAGAAAAFASFIKLKKNHSFKESVKLLSKKYLKTALVVLIVSVSVFGINKVSDALKYTVDGFEEFSEYNEALSSVNDYFIAFYPQNQEFYNSLDMNSDADLEVLRNWLVDDDFFTLEKVKAIGEYSKIHGNYDSGNRITFKKVFDTYYSKIEPHIKNGFIIIDAMIVLVVITAFFVLRVASKKVFNRLFPISVLALLWLFFFYSLDWSKDSHFLVFPIIALLVYICIFFNSRQCLISIIISVVFIAVYLYLQFEHIHFRATMCIMLPTLVLLVLTLSESNLNKPNLKKSIMILKPIVFAIMIAVSALTGYTVYNNIVYLEYPGDYDQVEEYIDSHPDTLFLKEGIFRSTLNFKPLLRTEPQSNLISAGGWDKKSPSYKNKLESLGIEHLFKDAIDSDCEIIFYNYNGMDSLSDAKTAYLAEYYNNHYSNGKTIYLEKTEAFEHYCLYKVISK